LWCGWALSPFGGEKQSVTFAGVINLIEIGGQLLLLAAGIFIATRLPEIVPAAADWALLAGLGGTTLVAVFAFMGLEGLANALQRFRGGLAHDPPRSSRAPSSPSEAMSDAGVFLVTGPANEKTELVKQIRQHAPALMQTIAAVEMVDHPSDGQLVNDTRRYFKADHMMPPRSAQR
jgi:hypothetical protein